MVCLLGSFSLLKHGVPLPVRTGGKTEALLATLALRGSRRLPREALLNEVWPDAEPGLAGQALNSLLHSLRKLLGSALGGAPPIVHQQGTYQLNLSAGVSVDFDYFDELADMGEALDNGADPGLSDPRTIAAYEQAISLYGGDLQAGENQAAIVERERLRARYLTLLVRCAGHYYVEGNITAALRLARCLLEHDPCREDAHRLVMRSHMQRGERAQALRQYRLCVQFLRSEFDVEPEPATVALYTQIRLSPESI
jgi:DNA-binding SARP family transcriptional activator